MIVWRARHPRVLDDEEMLHALRRNGVGARVIVALEELGPSTVGRLSRATGAARFRVRIAIRGDGKDCKFAHALETLGLVVRRGSGRRVEYDLTPSGRRWAARVRTGLYTADCVVRAYHRRGE